MYFKKDNIIPSKLSTSNKINKAYNLKFNNDQNVENFDRKLENNITIAEKEDSSKRPIVKKFTEVDKIEKSAFLSKKTIVDFDEEKDNYEEYNEELNKVNSHKTLRDLEALSIYERLKYDTRTFREFFWDNFSDEHLLLNIIFKQSLFIPRHLRIIRALNTISLMFVLNAMFFPDEMIEDQAASSAITGVIYYNIIKSSQLFQMKYWVI